MGLVYGDRPPFCIYKQCQPVIGHMQTEEKHANGYSAFCLGENSDMQSWTSGEVTHVNDLCFCSFTPFKGWIRFVMNNDDFKAIYKMIERFDAKTARNIL